MHTLKLARWDKILKFGRNVFGQKYFSQKRWDRAKQTKILDHKVLICKSIILWKFDFYFKFCQIGQICQFCVKSCYLGNGKRDIVSVYDVALLFAEKCSLVNVTFTPQSLDSITIGALLLFALAQA